MITFKPVDSTAINTNDTIRLDQCLQIGHASEQSAQSDTIEYYSFGGLQRTEDQDQGTHHVRPVTT